VKVKVGVRGRPLPRGDRARRRARRRARLSAPAAPAAARPPRGARPGGGGGGVTVENKFPGKMDSFAGRIGFWLVFGDGFGAVSCEPPLTRQRGEAVGFERRSSGVLASSRAFAPGPARGDPPGIAGRPREPSGWVERRRTSERARARVAPSRAASARAPLSSSASPRRSSASCVARARSCVGPTGQTAGRAGQTRRTVKSAAFKSGRPRSAPPPAP